MNGFLIVDKPQGLTSFDVVRRVRRLCQTRRVGHCGTLDPMATGVLPVAVGEATRMVEFVMDGDKTYAATLKLGETTDTQDAEGTLLLSRPLTGGDAAALAAAAARLTGEIEQLPPMYSALKRDGVPLYDLARRGIEVERRPRRVTVHAITITAVDLPYVDFVVNCSKGTYVRTLAYDLGEMLGCGAHLTRLRRLRTGPFAEDAAHDLETLQAAADGIAGYLLPAETALAAYPHLEIDAEAAVRLRNGIPPAITGIVAGALPVAGAITTLWYNHRLAAIVRFAPERIEEERGDFVLLRVFPGHL